MIAILADENVPGEAVRFLRDAGFNVHSIVETASGVSDLTVLELARAEDRILVTFDRDFGELIYRLGYPVPRGIIFLRLVPIAPDEAGVILKSLFEHSKIKLEGNFTTVTRDQIRQRPLP